VCYRAASFEPVQLTGPRRLADCLTRRRRGDQHGDRILRNETCSNDARHFGVGRRLENLPLLRQKLAATNERCLARQAEVLASTVDTGQLAASRGGELLVTATFS
jgi:hypothetical protein